MRSRLSAGSCTPQSCFWEKQSPFPTAKTDTDPVLLRVIKVKAFSSVTGKENFLTVIVPEGCLLIKASAVGTFGQKLVKLVSPIAKNTPN